MQPYSFTGDDPLNATDLLGQDWSDFLSFVIAVIANMHFTFGIPKGASDDLPDTKPERVEKPVRRTETQQPKDPDKMKAPSDARSSQNSTNSKTDDGNGSRGNSSNSNPQSDSNAPTDTYRYQWW
jgi:hypothetical protein